MASAHDSPGSQSVFPPSDAREVLVGMNFEFRSRRQPVMINLRFCGAGSPASPHLDVQLRAKTLREIDGVKLANHVPVDVARAKRYELQYQLLGYLALRPDVLLAGLENHDQVMSELGPATAVAATPALKDRVRRTLKMTDGKLAHLTRTFNRMYRFDVLRSRALERKINAELAALWQSAVGQRGRERVVDAMVALSRRRLVWFECDARDPSTEAYQAFLLEGQRALQEMIESARRASE
jgi:hypothetical protein